MTHTTATAPVQGCQSWCSNHANGSPANAWPLAADQICSSVVSSPAFGELQLTYTIDSGPVVLLYNALDEMTPPQAEQYAYAILAMTSKARGGAR